MANVRKFNEVLDEFQQNVVIDNLEGWELVEFLQIPIEKVLEAALDRDWIDDENVEDLRDYLNIKELN